MPYRTRALGASLLAVALAACSKAPEVSTAAVDAGTGTPYVVRDTTLEATLEASATADPLQRATLSTKLMATVSAVPVHEGDHVHAGQLLARLDARDLDAKRTQAQAGLAEAEAVHREALASATRFRALYADSAATSAQLDAVETGLARAESAVRAARAGGSELEAVASYATVTAPFTGVVTQRFVDVGAFAAPGSPLLTIEDGSMLRVRAAVAPASIRTLRRGGRIMVRVEGVDAVGTIEGVVPAPVGNLAEINVLVPNRDGRFIPGSAAVVLVPQGQRPGRLIPAAAVVREGDLAGVTVRQGGRAERRWIRLGAVTGTQVEVLSGLAVGDTVLVPAGGK